MQYINDTLDSQIVILFDASEHEALMLSNSEIGSVDTVEGMWARFRVRRLGLGCL